MSGDTWGVNLEPTDKFKHKSSFTVDAAPHLLLRVNVEWVMQTAFASRRLFLALPTYEGEFVFRGARGGSELACNPSRVTTFFGCAGTSL
jgi:hypothetical protein